MGISSISSIISSTFLLYFKSIMLVFILFVCENATKAKEMQRKHKRKATLARQVQQTQKEVNESATREPKASMKRPAAIPLRVDGFIKNPPLGAATRGNGGVKGDDIRLELMPLRVGEDNVEELQRQLPLAALAARADQRVVRHRVGSHTLQITSKSGAKKVQITSKSGAKNVQITSKSGAKKVQITSKSGAKKVQITSKSGAKKVQITSKSGAKNVQITSKSGAKNVQITSKSRKCKSHPSQAQRKCKSHPNQAQRKCKLHPSQAQRKCKSHPSQAQRKCKSHPSQAQRKCKSHPSQAQRKCK
jgi:hypothetical protein